VKTYALTLPIEVGQRVSVSTSKGVEQGELIGYAITATFIAFIVMFDDRVGHFQADQINSHRLFLDGYEFVGFAGAPSCGAI
jgi:hypothetical protein